MTTLSCYATFNGKQFPINRYSVNGGGYGTIGAARVTTTPARLKVAGIDPYADSSAANGPVEFHVYMLNGTTKLHLFGGVHIDTDYDEDNGLIHFNARDWSDSIADQKRVMTSVGKEVTAVLTPYNIGQTNTNVNLNAQNQKISDIVTSIAKVAGLTPSINLFGADSVHGTSYGSEDKTFFPAPQNLWVILNELARDTGNVCYVTPDKQLVFSAPASKLSNVDLCYNYNNLKAPKGKAPVMGLTLKHQPRRNSTFRVLITSYDPVKQAAVTGRATVVGGNTNGQGGLSVGIYSGQAAQSADAKLAKLGKGAGFAQIAVYTFPIDGLTSEQANTRALAMAVDISKHEMTMACSALTKFVLLPTQPLTLDYQNSTLPPQALKFFVSAYEYTFDGKAYTTGMRGLNIPLEALATDNFG